ncbi:MAG: hypothetical protein ACLFS9_01840 [Nitriliruptoraceae bacterium]
MDPLLALGIDTLTVLAARRPAPPWDLLATVVLWGVLTTVGTRVLLAAERQELRRRGPHRARTGSAAWPLPAVIRPDRRPTTVTRGADGRA